jgi:hypothetical protein
MSKLVIFDRRRRFFPTKLVEIRGDALIDAAGGHTGTGQGTSKNTSWKTIISKCSI